MMVQRWEGGVDKPRSTRDSWELVQGREGRERMLSWGLRSEHGLVDAWAGTSGPQGINVCCLKPRVCDHW